MTRGLTCRPIVWKQPASDIDVRHITNHRSQTIRTVMQSRGSWYQFYSIKSAIIGPMNSTSLTNLLVDQPAALTRVTSAFSTSTVSVVIRTLIPGLLLVVLSTSAMALEKADKGPLDQPIFQQANSPAAARQQLKQLRKSVEKERKRLKKLSEKKLKKAAKDGDRVAQLVLAESYAYEAHNNALTIGAANAAMGDALYWYSLAARRGYPGVPAIDKVMPQFPVRVIKGP